VKKTALGSDLFRNDELINFKKDLHIFWCILIGVYLNIISLFCRRVFNFSIRIFSHLVSGRKGLRNNGHTVIIMTIHSVYRILLIFSLFVTISLVVVLNRTPIKYL